MEQRLANTLRMTVNEKKFIETALLSDLRVDGRRPFDYRKLNIKFGREDGSSEVQLGQTHVMGFVTSQLVQPYRDRPNEGSLAIYTEFSPMADPSFEAGRPGESAIELGRVIDRGLRESRAVDTESLCVVAGKWVWSIRIDLQILDNGGNLVDAANIAALAALSTFRRPDCTLGGEDGKEIILHPPEVREPLPLVIHHMPIAVTFAFIGKGNIVVVDPTHFEEAVMGGRMTATVNANSDVCAIQKAGGDGVMQSVIMQCLRIASVKAGDITSKIKNAVESYSTERALRKIKRHTPATATIDIPDPGHGKVNDFSMQTMDIQRVKSEDCCVSHSDDMDVETQSSKPDGNNRGVGKYQKFSGRPSSWDPYSTGVNIEELKSTLALHGSSALLEKPYETETVHKKPCDTESGQRFADVSPAPLIAVTTGNEIPTNRVKTLKDAIKPKHKRKKKPAMNADAS
ncbi:exosome complex component RRP45A-like isoform X1 [Ipomoea triloba]|uniref:exosome complex component RRP45A-like isoform X1 n=2 Tax=Ipomoea triloba TaxID=35885 RepID=UPI00125CDC0A|nr:exosome complex component RRP45A-like isoform X1 [Ipomoea triloba]XP_031099459.1 exosome complex component RRP45A-like isoform X1 [Ipomoea triloba]